MVMNNGEFEDGVVQYITYHWTFSNASSAYDNDSSGTLDQKRPTTSILCISYSYIHEYVVLVFWCSTCNKITYFSFNGVLCI